MSSAHPSAVPSRGSDPEAPGFESSAAAVARLRGAPLLDALERRLPGARRHAEATGSYAFAAAVELGFARLDAELIREAARLHEIGKLYVPVDVVTAPKADLDAEDEARLNAQYAAAEGLARGAGISEQVCPWLRAVGERFDGRAGDGLAGDRIPAEARIIRGACMCDLVLAATDPRAPSAGGRLEAVRALRQAAGGDLDPQVVGALASVLARVR